MNKRRNFLFVLRTALFLILFKMFVCGGVSGESEIKAYILYSNSQIEKLKSGKDVLKNYTDALHMVGMKAVPLAPGDTYDFNGIDGLLIPGGGDFHPSFYNEEPKDLNYKYDMEFDRFEMEVLKSAWEKCIPIFGICKGEQFINVFLKGTLYQDLPSQIGIIKGINHRDIKSAEETNHIIEIKKNTILREILGCPVKIVNSSHHQAAKDIGKGLAVCAVSPDGVIEAVEACGERFCIGVQFHPERLIKKDVLFLKLFERFKKEAIIYRKKKSA